MVERPVETENVNLAQFCTKLNQSKIKSFCDCDPIPPNSHSLLDTFTYLETDGTTLLTNGENTYSDDCQISAASLQRGFS